MAEKHRLLGGKVHVYRRGRRQTLAVFDLFNGKNWRTTTKEESLAHAKEFAEAWFFELKGKSRAGILRKAGITFRQAADTFLQEYEVITSGERNPDFVESLRMKLRVHLLPFFGDKVLREITSGLVQQYRVHRATSRLDKKTGRPAKPVRSTLHHEIITLRHVLKTAERHGWWLEHIPNLSPPYKSSGKISHRAWFSPEEYTRLYEATRERARNPTTARWRNASERLHDYVLFMANTGLRPDEAKRLQFRDVTVVFDAATNKRILEIEVRGKRGVGHCKSMPGAVHPFERRQARNRGDATAPIFGKIQRELFNTILDELGLKFDRDGNRRSAYSLRHTYICLRLLQGADIYQAAKNCRTSVEMIEKFYAVHLKNTLDASAINVRKPLLTTARPASHADNVTYLERRSPSPKTLEEAIST